MNDDQELPERSEAEQSRLNDFAKRLEGVSSRAMAAIDAMDVGGVFITIGMRALGTHLTAEGVASYLHELAKEIEMAGQVPASTHKH
jgi:hypothetical protein